jgi:UDP-N-acetylglucosamine:LPS N-acetylglucosamine transferase
VAFVALSGGHLEEISRLRKIEREYDCFLVTEKSGYEDLAFCDRRYHVMQMNRRQPGFPFKFLLLFLQAFWILAKEKPEFLVTTGALIAYPFCIIGKFMGAKIIYVESYARVCHPSLTGRLLYNFSDLFVVQWSDMLRLYPKSILGGGIF